MALLLQMGMPDTDVRWVGAVMLAPPNNGSALANTIMQVGLKPELIWMLDPENPNP